MPHRILVVDDDADVREMVCRILESNGYVAIPAAGGRQAVERLQTDTPDLVITDVVMPEVDGFEVLLKLRLLTPGVGALVMSGGGRLEPEAYLGMATKLGAYDILRKPFTKAEILKAVKRALISRTSYPLKELSCPRT
ncbi:MAG: response regulator [Humidesulfovibrio sp.]|uniref:response regulator n=1 Tax=Humidesulfovibrio sp. TaxID=2910988 RepID=UPI0027F69027|nr:response regulator [Humidesulfovibrio sp.]MDQ7834290.1 response regulator [Humidesulfovibrio sp.]